MNIHYSTARINKDKNFDGKFFFGVKTTGVFCRPSCPSPLAKEENVLYFNSVFHALEAGFRPCHRCRPDIETEYYSSFTTGSETVGNAVRLIYEGFLNYNSLPDLADKLNISERYLRKLFVDNLGLSPVKIARYHKAVFARKLLLNSNIPVTRIASASGFGSSRQFNDVYKEIYNETPSKSRKCSGLPGQVNTVFLLKYSSPFNFKQLLSFIRLRAIRGVEIVSDDKYMRSFRTSSSHGYFTVMDDSENSALRLEIVSDDVRCYMELYSRIRTTFDLDTDFNLINEKLKNEDLLSRGMKDGHVPRLPVAFNVFEFAVRAVLGQQISVKAATTFAARIAESAGIITEEEFPEGLEFYFPNAEELLKTNLDNIGLTLTRRRTLLTMTENVLSGGVKLNSNQTFEKFYSDFTTLKGIGDWTANYVAMRGLGMMDAFPALDLGIVKALTTGNVSPSLKKILGIAENWRPYRAYAALCLWNLDN